MGHGNAAGFLGVIVKVCLCIHISVVTDDLDGVLVCTYGTVCAQTPELTVGGSLRGGNQRSAYLQRQVGHIVNDADGEFLLCSIVIYSNDLSRSGVLGTQTVTALSLIHIS